MIALLELARVPGRRCRSVRDNAELPRIKVLAPAKVNLCLEVSGLRPDGYHEIRSILQQIDITDELVLRRDPALEVFEFELDPPVPGVPPGEENLCWRAYRRFREVAGAHVADEGLRLTLGKRIPVAAGLGGGSADAAATLVALNLLYGGLLDEPSMLEIAADLGSDVSFFLRGGTALAEGRGERVRRMAEAAPLWVVLAKPPRALSAGEVYRTFDSLGSEGAIGGSCDPAAWERVLREGEVVPIERMMRNDLQPAVLGSAPECEELISAAQAAGAGAMVSGSGPTVFALAKDPARARMLMQYFEPYVSEVLVAGFGSGGCLATAKVTPPDDGK
jgi:4-diphosphocytidyl-2-C-methyl-D-erythritol kinase